MSPEHHSIYFTDTEIAKAAELMKKDVVLLQNLTTFFRVVLTLDDGTVEDISQRHATRPKDRLDAGITEWQKMAKRNIYNLIQAFQNAIHEMPLFVRITSKA